VHSQKSFFEKLFDISFSSFITPQIVGVLYVIGLIAGVLIALRAMYVGFRFGGLFGGLEAAIIAIILLFIYAIVSRISLEGFVAVIRTAENTRILAEEVLSRSANGSEQN